MEISQLNGNPFADAAFRKYIETEGAVIFSFNDEFSPADLWGGSWEKIIDRVLVGAGGSYSLGNMGGDANVTLTEDQMPNHQHQVIDGDTGVIMGLGTGAQVDGITIGSWNNTNNVGKLLYTNAKGGNQAHNNMPPYVSCNIWRKVA